MLGKDRARNILVAYDGTVTAERAFVKALDVAERDAARLHIRTVIRPKTAPDDIDTKREASLTWRRLLVTRARERGIEANFATVESESPARGIALEAQRIHAVLIVVGHRHRELCQKWLDTSIATRVVDHALCDVLVVS